MCFLGHVNTNQRCEIQSVGVFKFKRCCEEWSVYDIKVPREPFESIRSICSHITLAVLWCNTLTILRRRLLKSNAPNVKRLNLKTTIKYFSKIYILVFLVIALPFHCGRCLAHKYVKFSGESQSKTHAFLTAKWRYFRGFLTFTDGDYTCEM